MKNTILLFACALLFLGTGFNSSAQTFGGAPHNIKINNNTERDQIVNLELIDVRMYDAAGNPLPANTCGSPLWWTPVLVPANSSYKTTVMVHPSALMSVRYFQSCPTGPGCGPTVCGEYYGVCGTGTNVNGYNCPLPFVISNINDPFGIGVPATVNTYIVIDF